MAKLAVVLGLFALLALSFAGEVKKSAEEGDLKTASSYGLGFGYGGWGWGGWGWGLPYYGWGGWGGWGYGYPWGYGGYGFYG